MGRRTVLLVAALVVAALGTALVFMYANRADERAQAGTEQVQVLVATAGIAAGTTGADVAGAGTVELQTLPAASVPDQALSDLTPVSDLITVSSIFPGQVLIAPMFGTQQNASGALTLPEGTVAVALQLGDPQRVAGFVNPGSEVAIFRTGPAPIAVDPADKEAVPGEQQATALLLDRVSVIAVGPTTVSNTTTTDGQTTNTEAIPTAILTLALDQEQAQKVILSTTDGAMYFALLDENSKLDATLPPTTTTDLLARG
ncbi:MAG: Flp pilus assembly protein CpaB [Candidatus Nanopelagicales bacterium]